jgi:hypothetical protein
MIAENKPLWNKHRNVFKNLGFSLVLVAHTYNHSYLGSGDQGNHGSKPAWTNSS